VFLENLKGKMENDVNSSIDAAIIKLADQAKASSNDHVKALGFAAAVEKLSSSRALLTACNPTEPAKKNN
jgi:hypothetical protein